MHITDWLEMLGEHFPLVVIGCAEALLAVVLLCAALRNRRQCADKNGAHSGGQKDVSVWKKYCAWDGAQPFETVLRTKNGEWVQTQGLNSLTQPAAYYRLTGDAPEANTVEISVQNASRDAVYAPASMEKVTDGDVHERRDALLKGRGLFGTRNYMVTEVSGTRPSELMVAESWVSSPQTEEQTAYAEAESVYRSFVYDAYTAADEKLLPVLNRLFWQDYDDENDGVYSALSRIREVLTEQPDLANAAEPVDTVPNGQIDFEGVSFKYNAAAQKSALSDITLHIPAGATVGIIGGTGSAKTTLVQLIPRLYDATEGTVKVGGRDVRDYDLTALRDAVGIVLQKNLLFSGTIRDNLKWGNPDAAEEQLWAACRAAHADEFLDRMPDGLDTDLGQGGINVSGGQKQRLCIARTLLKHPKVLIFDDSTSAVDTATESGIRRALAELTDVTKLIIAQRISSVQSADLIVILEDGRLHAVGTHAELLEKDTIYQEIYYSQMKGGDPDGE